MRKKVLVGLGVSLLFVAAGALYASNMAFKLNYTLLGQGASSKNGTSTVGLPFNQQTNLVNASDLLNDIGGTAVLAQVARFDPTTNGAEVYTGTAGVPFALASAKAYLVQLKPGVPTRQYIIVGSHDPTKVVVFDGQGTNGSKNGTSFYSHPYHAISNDASELLNELGGTAVIGQVARFVKTTNGAEVYTGSAGIPFPLAPGEGYFIQLRPGVPSVQFIPAHY